MQASITLTKWDYFKFQLYMLPRSKFFYGAFVFSFLVQFSINFFFAPKVMTIGQNIMSATSFGLLFVVIMIVISLGFVMFVPSNRNNIIGSRTFIISDEGLLVESQKGDGLVCWSAIERIIESNQSILFKMGAAFHILPKRSFANSSDCQAFLLQAKKYWAAGQGKQDEGCVLPLAEGGLLKQGKAVHSFSTDIGKIDFIKYHWSYYKKIRLHWIIFALCFLMIWIIATNNHELWVKILVVLFMAGGLTLFVMGFFMAFSILLVWMSSGKKTGNSFTNMGAFHYRLSGDSLLSQSAAGENEVAWEGVDKVQRFGDYMVFRTGYFTHLIPPKSFSSAVQREQVFRYALTQWEKTHG